MSCADADAACGLRGSARDARAPRREHGGIMVKQREIIHIPHIRRTQNLGDEVVEAIKVRFPNWTGKRGDFPEVEMAPMSVHGWPPSGVNRAEETALDDFARTRRIFCLVFPMTHKRLAGPA